MTSLGGYGNRGRGDNTILNPFPVQKFVSPLQAIRSALAKIGYNDLPQSLQPELIEWAIEASDMICKPKTFKIESDDFVVCGNKIQLGQQVLLVNCASYNGQPMELISNRGCSNRCTQNSKNRCCRSNQKFYLDECYIHFKPTLEDGSVVHVEWLQRAYAADGYPLILDNCNMAISEYIASIICARFNDNRYALWDSKWQKHCLQARAEVNRITQAQVEALGFLFDSNPGGNAKFSVYWTSGNLGW